MYAVALKLSSQLMETIRLESLNKSYNEDVHEFDRIFESFRVIFTEDFWIIIVLIDLWPKFADFFKVTVLD